MTVAHEKHVASIHFHVVSPLVWRSHKSAHALNNSMRVERRGGDSSETHATTLMPMDESLNTNKYVYIISSIDSSTLNVHYPDIGIRSALV